MGARSRVSLSLEGEVVEWLLKKDLRINCLWSEIRTLPMIRAWPGTNCHGESASTANGNRE